MAQIKDTHLKSIAREKDLRSEEHDSIFRHVSRNLERILYNDQPLWTEKQIIDALDIEHSLEAGIRQLNELIKDPHKASSATYPVIIMGESSSTSPHNRTPNNNLAEKRVAWANRQLAIFNALPKSVTDLRLQLGEPNFSRVLESKQLQYPLYQSSGRNNSSRKLIAIMDMKASYTIPALLTIGPFNFELYSIDNDLKRNDDPEQWEYLHPTYVTEFSNEDNWYVDIRSSATNVGQLLREANIIRSYLHQDSPTGRIKYSIVAPMTKEIEDILEEAHIHTVNSKSLNI